MAPKLRHIVHQHRVIGSLSGVVLRAVLQRLERGEKLLEALPGPELEAEIAPLPAALIRDYVRHVNGDPRAYARTVPPHLFPHWSLPLAAQTLRKLPYPLLRVLNGGCRLELNAPLAADEPLLVRARLEAVEDDGRRAVLHQRIITGQRSAPDALVAHLYAVVPSARSKPNPSEPRKSKRVELIPSDAREIDSLVLRQNAGLEFALLTGDFNPVHWLTPYARALGHGGRILHGFASMAHLFESLKRTLPRNSAETLRVFDARFLRPLVLPAALGVFVEGERVFLGARGQPAIVVASHSSADSSRAGAKSETCT